MIIGTVFAVVGVLLVVVGVALLRRNPDSMSAAARSADAAPTASIELAPLAAIPAASGIAPLLVGMVCLGAALAVHLLA